MKVPATTLVLLLLLPMIVHAQRPDTVFFEDLTFDEIRDLIKGGARGVIVATARKVGGHAGIQDTSQMMYSAAPSSPSD